MEAILNKIKKESPLAYAEFKAFLKTNYEGYFEFHKISRDTLPFEMLLGFFISFFDKNQIDFSISTTNREEISTTILETFEGFEKVIGHFS